MREPTRDHVFAATNFFLGPTNFLVVRVATRWEVRIGRNPSEVDYTTTLEDIRWATEGRATGFLVDPTARRAIELEIRAARAAAPRSPNLPVSEQGACRVGGHPASFAIGEVRQGLTRKRARVLRVSFRCDQTNRSVELRFTGACEPADLREFLGPLEGARCH